MGFLEVMLIFFLILVLALLIAAFIAVVEQERKNRKQDHQINDLYNELDHMNARMRQAYKEIGQVRNELYNHIRNNNNSESTHDGGKQ